MYDNLKRRLLDLPQVEKVAFTSFAPYEMSRWTADYSLPDGSRKTDVHGLAVSDDFFAAMDMTPAEGRWFSSVDDAADAAPTVINRRLANSLFPGKSAVGQVFIDAEAKDKPQRYRVSAVVEHFRSHGEYMDPVDFMLPRFIPGVGKNPAMTIVLKLKPGTPRAFESTLNARLKQLNSDWSYVIAGDGGVRAVRRAVAKHHAAHPGDRPAPRAGRRRRQHLPPDHHRAAVAQHRRDRGGDAAAGAAAADRRIRRKPELAGVFSLGGAIGKCDLSAILAVFALPRLARRAPQPDASAAL
jgi:hypothetical protein